MDVREQRVITTTLYKGLAVVATALLTGSVAGAFVGYNTAVSDHFTLIRAVEDLNTVRATYVTQSQLQAEQQAQNQRFEDLVKTVDKNYSALDKKMDNIMYTQSQILGKFLK